MLKNIVISFVLCAALFTSVKAYSQADIQGQSIKYIKGKVVDNQVDGNYITVLTDNGKMDFYITIQTVLLRNNTHMASVEINHGDQVVIEYAANSTGRNDIILLKDKTMDEIDKAGLF